MSFRNAFQPILDNPDKFPEVLFYDEHAVILKDKYPKLLRHYLVLPRDSEVTHNHPLTAFREGNLHEQLTEYVEKAEQMILDDLAEVLEAKDSLKLKSLRLFIQTGVHSSPLLRNLHIHVMTKDFYTPCMKNKKHYNSFTTPFFVPFHKLAPQANDDSNDEAGSSPSPEPESLLKGKLRCSYCFTNFDNSFASLKKHLQKEYQRKYGDFGVDPTKLVANGR